MNKKLALSHYSGKFSPSCLSRYFWQLSIFQVFMSNINFDEYATWKKLLTQDCLISSTLYPCCEPCFNFKRSRICEFFCIFQYFMRMANQQLGKYFIKSILTELESCLHSISLIIHVIKNFVKMNFCQKVNPRNKVSNDSKTMSPC